MIFELSMGCIAGGADRPPSFVNFSFDDSLDLPFSQTFLGDFAIHTYTPEALPIQPKQARALLRSLYKFMAASAINQAVYQLPLPAPPVLDQLWLRAMSYRQKYDQLSQNVGHWLTSQGVAPIPSEIKRTNPFSCEKPILLQLLHNLPKTYRRLYSKKPHPSIYVGYPLADSYLLDISQHIWINKSSIPLANDLLSSCNSEDQALNLLSNFSVVKAGQTKVDFKLKLEVPYHLFNEEKKPLFDQLYAFIKEYQMPFAISHAISASLLLSSSQTDTLLCDYLKYMLLSSLCENTTFPSWPILQVLQQHIGDSDNFDFFLKKLHYENFIGRFEPKEVERERYSFTVELFDEVFEERNKCFWQMSEEEERVRVSVAGLEGQKGRLFHRDWKTYMTDFYYRGQIVKGYDLYSQQQE